MKKRLFRVIVSALLLLAFAAGMCALLKLSSQRRKAVTCSALKVETKGEWLDSLEIARAIDSFYGTYIGVGIEDIDLLKIEQMLRTRPEVKDAQVWIGDDGILHADLKGRTPVLRFVYGGSSSFVDADGFFFPASSAADSSDVTVIECSPKIAAGKPWLDSMLSLTLYIEGSSEWRGRIEGYTFSKEEGLVMLAKSSEKLIFGDLNEQKRKMRSLRTYFEKIAPLDKGYKSVNVKYKDQIICRKDS